MTDEKPSCCGCKSEQPSIASEPPASVSASSLTLVSVFNVPQMDCPSEEGLIRTAFASVEQGTLLDFDLGQRQVTVYHSSDVDDVSERMRSVGLGAALVSHENLGRERAAEALQSVGTSDTQEAKTLKVLLVINAVMFALELTMGLIAHSAGLIADSLDMFADAAVYGVALYAVGKGAQAKLKAAHLSGWLQLALALGVLLEVLRRATYGSEPISTLMMGVGAIALMANIACLLLIFKSRNSGAHMKASWIFSANDVLANAGVILAGTLVALTGSQIPDLVIGIIIGLLVLNGARRILLLR